MSRQEHDQHRTEARRDDASDLTVSVVVLALDSFGECADAPADLLLADVAEAEHESGRARVRFSFRVCGHEPVAVDVR